MLAKLKELFRKLLNRGERSVLPDDDIKLPGAAPSAEDIDFPFNPLDYVISPQELKSHMEQGSDIVLIDVREEWEYNKGHIEDAVMLPFEQLHQWIHQFDFDREIIIYSHRGVWSMPVAYILQQIGYRNVKSLAGGIDRWSMEIDPTIKRY